MSSFRPYRKSDYLALKGLVQKIFPGAKVPELPDEADEDLVSLVLDNPLGGLLIVLIGGKGYGAYMLFDPAFAHYPEDITAQSIQDGLAQAMQEVEVKQRVM